MKSKLHATPIEKKPVHSKLPKLDEKEVKRGPHQKIQNYAEKFDSAESDKEIQAGEKEDDFPPDVYDDDAANREAVNIRQN